MQRNDMLLAALFLAIAFAPYASASVYQSDGTPSNIQSIHDSQAHSGDTILVPSGTFTWTAGITITKAITLQGQGIGQTIIRDAGGNGPHNWTLVAGQPSRMTGIEFQDGGRATTKYGWLLIHGSNTNGSTFRMDHCKFNDVNGD